MATNFSDALASEIAELEQQLEGDPRFAKLRELNRVQKLYAPAHVGEASPSPVMVPTRAPSTAGRSPSPQRQTILENAKHLARGRTEPIPTSTLHDGLVTLGISIPGTSPKNNLSAMLSNSPDFKSHGRAGWTLNETPEASGELLGGTPPEASMSSPASPAGEPSAVRPVDPVPGGGG